MTEDSGVPPRQPRGLVARLFGEAATPSAPRPARPPVEAPPAVRRAALVVGLEAALIGLGALVLLYLTLTSTPDSLSRAVAEVTIVAAGAVVLAACAAGLRRVAAWARGPVVVLQILLALLAFTTAFQAQQPLIGLPVLALAGTTLYLLATPEARLAFLER